MSKLLSFRPELSSFALAVCAALFYSPASHSHITLETKEAAVDSGYKAVFGVPHGCKGSPTVKIHVQIPEGVIGVKPQPKVGWTLDIVKGDYAQSYKLHGRDVTSGVKEVVWSGGSLPDDQYDEFVFVSYLSDTLSPDSDLYFPVYQECEEGSTHWVDVPTGGHHGGGHGHSASPAPSLKLRSGS